MEAITIVQQTLAVFSGALVGFSLGLIGGGGSILAVPLLLYVVGYHDPHTVLGTTAAAVAVTALIGVIPHWRAGHVRWKPGLVFAVTGALGAAVGAALGKAMPGKQLLFLFALLMLAVAAIMLRSALRARKPEAAAAEGETRGERGGAGAVARAVPTALAVGGLSGFFGIGGGFLIVPGLLLATGMSMINAIGTSLLSVGAFGATTALSYALAGKVNWLLAAEYVVGGVLGGWLGTALASRLAPNRRALTIIFSGVIVVVAIYMLYVNAVALHLIA
ncbi:MAG TPA: sulfite exporter TauE/SafE family protein [Ktedonobacterales bacterium]